MPYLTDRLQPIPTPCVRINVASLSWRWHRGGVLEASLVGARANAGSELYQETVWSNSYSASEKGPAGSMAGVWSGPSSGGSRAGAVRVGSAGNLRCTGIGLADAGSVRKAMRRISAPQLGHERGRHSWMRASKAAQRYEARLGSQASQAPVAATVWYGEADRAWQSR